MKNKKIGIVIGLGLLLVVVGLIVFSTQKSTTFALPDKDVYTFADITGNQLQKVKYITSEANDSIDVGELLNTWSEEQEYVATKSPATHEDASLLYFHGENKEVLFAVREMPQQKLIQVLIDDEIYTYKVVQNDESK